MGQRFVFNYIIQYISKIVKEGNIVRIKEKTCRVSEHQLHKKHITHQADRRGMHGRS